MPNDTNVDRFREEGNLVTEPASDVFVRDLARKTTRRVSLSFTSAQANNHSFAPALSAAGRYVAFVSVATNLVRRDRNGRRPDVFVRDTIRGTTELVSVSSGERQGNAESGFPSVSADGRYVAFSSRASNLVRATATAPTTASCATYGGEPPSA